MRIATFSVLLDPASFSFLLGGHLFSDAKNGEWDTYSRTEGRVRKGNFLENDMGAVGFLVAVDQMSGLQKKLSKRGRGHIKRKFSQRGGRCFFGRHFGLH